MNQKDLIKYGLLALGAYLIWEYIQKNGGISGLVMISLLFGLICRLRVRNGRCAGASHLLTADLLPAARSKASTKRSKCRFAALTALPFWRFATAIRIAIAASRETAIASELLQIRATTRFCPDAFMTLSYTTGGVV